MRLLCDVCHPTLHNGRTGGGMMADGWNVTPLVVVVVVVRVVVVGMLLVPVVLFMAATVCVCV
ncbi:hypothetical protein Hanom_Chr10g00946091 [Helianthus anomalus]